MDIERNSSRLVTIEYLYGLSVGFLVHEDDVPAFVMNTYDILEGNQDTRYYAWTVKLATKPTADVWVQLEGPYYGKSNYQYEGFRHLARYSGPQDLVLNTPTYSETTGPDKHMEGTLFALYAAELAAGARVGREANQHAHRPLR